MCIRDRAGFLRDGRLLQAHLLDRADELDLVTDLVGVVVLVLPLREQPLLIDGRLLRKENPLVPTLDDGEEISVSFEASHFHPSTVAICAR